MAKPAFIYAFDNLGPEKFSELCGHILAIRYKGFLLGGVGPDGGVDGEIDEILGEWYPESEFPILNELIQPGHRVVFQFKHKVTSRVGQAESRNQLLNLYQCGINRKCELHRDLIIRKQPKGYVLVTNVEINSQFRSKFIQQCHAENSDIKHYQIIGLDELEMWVTMETQLRHLYFPTIFGVPRFDLRMHISIGISYPTYGGKLDLSQKTELLQISILNVGTVTSYVNSLNFGAIVDGEEKNFSILLVLSDQFTKQINPELGTPLEPGRKQVFHFPIDSFYTLMEQGKKVFPFEFVISDEIGNTYSEPLPEEIRNKIISLNS